MYALVEWRLIDRGAIVVFDAQLMLKTGTVGVCAALHTHGPAEAWLMVEPFFSMNTMIAAPIRFLVIDLLNLDLDEPWLPFVYSEENSIHSGKRLGLVLLSELQTFWLVPFPVLKVKLVNLMKTG